MIIGALLGEGWAAMRANRLRTLLTMLGMVFGVGAVIMMLAIGQGAQLMVNESIASMGSNLFIVLSGSTTAGGLRQGSGTVPTLTLADAQAIGELPEIAAVAPTFPNNAQLIYASSNWSTQVSGTTPAFLDVREWPVISGEAFSDSDVRSATRVLLMGQTVARNLFGDENPVGKMVRVKNSPFLVLGILASKGQSLDGRDQDDTVFVPITTAQRQLFGNQFPGMVRFIMVKAKSAEVMDRAEQSMNELLRTRHRIHRRTRRRFYGPQPHRSSASRCRHHQGNVDDARRHRVGIAAGRRYRHHEYHAGFGHRKNPRNRHPHGDRRKTARYFAAISV